VLPALCLFFFVGPLPRCLQQQQQHHSDSNGSSSKQQRSGPTKKNKHASMIHMITQQSQSTYGKINSNSNTNNNILDNTKTNRNTKMNTYTEDEKKKRKKKLKKENKKLKKQLCLLRDNSKNSTDMDHANAIMDIAIAHDDAKDAKTTSKKERKLLKKQGRCDYNDNDGDGNNHYRSVINKLDFPVLNSPNNPNSNLKISLVGLGDSHSCVLSSIGLQC